MIKYRVGDVFQIKLDGERTILGRIVYAFKRNRNIVLFELNSPNLGVDNWNPIAQFYGHHEKIKSGEWPVVANIPYGEQEIKKTLRLRAGKVWLGDDIVRDATEEDYTLVDRELIAGYQAIFNRIEKIYSGDQ